MPSKKHTIKIVIAEDHTLMRERYVSLLVVGLVKFAIKNGIAQLDKI